MTVNITPGKNLTLQGGIELDDAMRAAVRATRAGFDNCTDDQLASLYDSLGPQAQAQLIHKATTGETVTDGDDLADIAVKEGLAKPKRSKGKTSPTANAKPKGNADAAGA